MSISFTEFEEQQRQERRDFVLDALASNDWVLTKAAKQLEIFPSSLGRMIRRLDLEPEYLYHSKNAGKAGRKPK